jgi:hypothetical protein
MNSLEPNAMIFAAEERKSELGLSQEDQHKIFYANARRILNLKDPAPAASAKLVREAAPAK